MTTSFTNYKQKDIGVTPVTVLTGAVSTQTTCIGLSVSNTSASPVSVDVYLTSSTVNYYILKKATIPVGGALTLFGGDGKLVMVPGDALKVVSDTSASVDAILSVMLLT